MQIERNCEIYEGKCGCETYEEKFFAIYDDRASERERKKFRKENLL